MGSLLEIGVRGGPMRVLGLLAGAVVGVGCGDAGASGDPGGTGTYVPGGCLPGEYQACPCEAGFDSIQECLADGSLGPCDCEEWAEGPASFGGGTNPQEGVVVVKLPVSDVLADPASDVLYASVVQPADPYGDSVVAISATTGAVLWSVAVGDVPGRLAISDDASTLYVALREPAALARIDTATHAETARYTMPVQDKYFVRVAVVPGSTNRLLVSSSDYADLLLYGRLVLLVDGVEVSALGELSYPTAGAIFAKTATTAFNIDSDGTLTDIAIGASSITAGTASTDLLRTPSSSGPYDVAYDGAWFVGDNGRVADEAHAFIGTYDLRGAPASDPAADRIYVASRSDDYHLAVATLQRSTLTVLGTTAFPDFGEPTRRTALSQAGTLAVIDGGSSPDESDNQLVLLDPTYFVGN
jgi:DNA-binding beta-propeller fold protein YncE